MEAPANAAPLRKDRREDPDWLFSGKGMASVLLDVFIALGLRHF
jgi:hypothetical protein